MKTNLLHLKTNLLHLKTNLLLLLTLLLLGLLPHQSKAQKFVWAKCEKASLTDEYPQTYFRNLKMVYDKWGNVYVIGELIGAFTFENGAIFDEAYNLYFAKYDPDGKLLWVKRINLVQAEDGNSGQFENMSIHSAKDYIYLSLSASENMYIDNESVITVLPSAQRTGNSVLIKYNLDGQMVWKKNIVGIPKIVGNFNQSGNVIIKSIDTDSQGNAYLLLETEDYFDLGDGVERISQRRFGLAVVKYDTNGNYQWHLLLNDTATSSYMRVWRINNPSLKVNQQGEVYVISYYEPGILIDNQEVTNQFTALSKIGSQGQLLWNQFVDAPNNGYQIAHDGYGFLLDSQGNPYLIDDWVGVIELNGGIKVDLGPFEASNGGLYKMAFIAKINPQDGKIMWAKSFKNRKGYTLNAATIDDQDNFYFTGVFDEQFVIGDKSLWADRYQTFIFKTNVNGELIWTHQIAHERLGGYSEPMSIVAPPDGHVYINGLLVSDNIFNCTTLSTRNHSPFLAKIIQSPLNISGAVGVNNQFCQNTTEASLSVKPIVGAKTYAFLFPPGITIPNNIVEDSPNTSKFNLTHYAPLGIQKVEVLAYNACAELIARGTIDLEVLPIPTRPNLPQGEVVVCAGKSYTYQVEPINYNEKYEWDLPNGVIPVNGTNITNTPQISLIFSKDITEALIAVRGKNTRCGYGLLSPYQQIWVRQLPPQSPPHRRHQ